MVRADDAAMDLFDEEESEPEVQGGKLLTKGGRLDDEDEEDEDEEDDGRDIPEAEEAKERKDKKAGQDGGADGDPLAKKRKPRPKFTENHLVGDKGLERIYKTFPDLCRFRGAGHEADDLRNLVRRYMEWAYQLFPNLAFEDFLSALQKLSGKARVRHEIEQLRDAQRQRFLEQRFGQDYAQKVEAYDQKKAREEAEREEEARRRREKARQELKAARRAAAKKSDGEEEEELEVEDLGAVDLAELERKRMEREDEAARLLRVLEGGGQRSEEEGRVGKKKKVVRQKKQEAAAAGKKGNKRARRRKASVFSSSSSSSSASSASSSDDDHGRTKAKAAGGKKKKPASDEDQEEEDSDLEVVTEDNVPITQSQVNDFLRELLEELPVETTTLKIVMTRVKAHFTLSELHMGVLKPGIKKSVIELTQAKLAEKRRQEEAAAAKPPQDDDDEDYISDFSDMDVAPVAVEGARETDDSSGQTGKATEVQVEDEEEEAADATPEALGKPSGDESIGLTDEDPDEDGGSAVLKDGASREGMAGFEETMPLSMPEEHVEEQQDEEEEKDEDETAATPEAAEGRTGMAGVEESVAVSASVDCMEVEDATENAPDSMDVDEEEEA